MGSEIQSRQSEELIRMMTEKAFGDRKIGEILELTEGSFNVAYRILFADGEETILKIAPEDKSRQIACEVNLMVAETTAMKLALEKAHVPAPKLFYFDDSRTLCKSDYFFMERMPGNSFHSVEADYTEKQKKVIGYEVGQLLYKLHQVKGTKFGLLGDTEHQFDTMYEYLYYYVDELLKNSEEAKIDLTVPYDLIREKLQADKHIFDEVTEPSLVFWDSWNGNIFVKDGHVTGLIDWERACWSEGLMEDRFRTHSYDAAFYEGYGVARCEAERTSEKQRVLTATECRRQFWYDVYLYIIMMTEGAPMYRNYPDDGQYQWIRGVFSEVWKKHIQ